MPPTERPYRIVIGTDFSDTAGRAISEALSIAGRHPAAELHLTAVIDSDHAELLTADERKRSLPQIADQLYGRLANEGGQARASFHAAYPGRPLVALAHVRFGQTAEQIAALAAEIRADLVVVGTHGRRGIRRLMLGSVAERTVRLAPCPVLVVRPCDYSAMDGLPVIEPVCPQCLRAREESGGARWWCVPHESAPEEPHYYSRSRRLDEPPSSIYSPGS